MSFIGAEDNLLNEHGRLDLPSDYSRTEAAGVFAAGDVAHGPKQMIDAIASGKQAARKIYTYVTKKNLLRKTSISHAEN